MSIAKWLLAKKLGGGSPFPPVIKRVTGNPIEFTDGADAPLVKCVTEIQGYQEGSGTPSSENIRPIHARSGNAISILGIEKYGFHIDGSKSAPSEMVTYLSDCDNANYTPAHMDYSNDKFDYGSWENAWFIQGIRPCILGTDGTVIKYLDKDDYNKDIDGYTVDIGTTLANANVMIEFPKIWYKVVPDANDDSSGSVYISNVRVDPDYKDYAYIDYQGIHKEHFYMPAYNGSYINNVMRSVSGAQVGKSQTGTTEISRAQANGAGWYTEDAGEIMLINFLLILLGKSCNTQAVFGQGLNARGTEALNDGFRTGVHNTKGMFYGTNSGTESSTTYDNAVKVFGIENYWGFQWRRYAGDMCLAGNRVIKLCWGTEDGSTTNNFNTTGSGYVSVGTTPSGSSGGYINKMKFAHDGMYSSVSSGTSTTYYCDGQWFNNSANTYALRGGISWLGALVGAFCVALSDGVGGSWWYSGAAVSYK